ncbi:MAG: glycosyltransferase family 4 protein [Coriobacteriia bacterium]
MVKRIALVAFKFPPYDQVGARRWTKLVKYMAAQGVEVDVFTTDWGRGTVGMSDVRDPRIRIHRVPCPGLHRLWYARFDRQTLAGRLGWFAERVLTRFVRHWPIFEEARFWRRLVGTATQVMAERAIETLVVTGPPFWSVHWAAEVARRRPSARLIVDYRDPWNALIAERPTAAMRREHAEQVEILGEADAAVAVTEGRASMLNDLGTGTPVHVISNGYDPDEIRDSGGVGTAREPLLLHAGNLFAGREQPLERLLEAIAGHRADFPDLRFVFYGGFPAHLARSYQALIDIGVIEIKARVDPDTLMHAISEAYACLQFNAERTPYALSTKIYEYGAARRPVLSVNFGGEIEAFIDQHHLGWSARADHPASIVRALREVQSTWRRNPSFSTTPTGLAAYDYTRLAERYLHVLSAIRR